MSKWEEKYNELKPKIDNMIKAQNTKINKIKRNKADLDKAGNLEASKKKTDELNNAKKEKQRLEKLKSNLRQVSNIIEYREKLKIELKELKEEVQRRNNLKQAAKKKEELESTILGYQKRAQESEIVKKIKEVNRKLKENLSPEERDKQEDKLLDLEIEREKLGNQMAKTQDELNKQEEILKNGLGRKTAFSELSQEDIEKQSFDIKNKINKCDLVANCLVNGLSWDSIDMKLDNWKDKKFTAKDDKLSKAKENAKKDLEKDNKEEPEKNPEEKQQPDIESDMELGNSGINAGFPMVKSTFADRHPRLAKIGKFFKNIFSKSKKLDEEKVKSAEDLMREIEEIEAQMNEVDKKVKDEIGENVQEIMKDKSVEELPFKEYIREIARKGMAGVEREQREAREKEAREQREAKGKQAREKLAEKQRANRAAEEKKFGKAYADMSRTDDGAR